MKKAANRKKFVHFCLIGGIGFVIDSVCFYLLLNIIPEMMLCRLLSFWVAATTTWLGNRLLTFAHAKQPAKLAQWMRHMLVAHSTGVINLIVFYLTEPIIGMTLAFCLGVALALILNYGLSKSFVFRQQNTTQ